MLCWLCFVFEYSKEYRYVVLGAYDQRDDVLWVVAGCFVVVAIAVLGDETRLSER